MKLTNRTVKALTPPPTRKEDLHWDDALPGFGVRVTAAGARSYVAQYTDPQTRKRRRQTLGSANVLSADFARDKALRIFASLLLDPDAALLRKCRRGIHLANPAW